MRWFAALLSLLALAAAAPRKQPRDWTRVATKTAAGAYVVGNPDARVQLIEYASYTCPHCAHFSAESGPVLKERMIRDGTVRLEFRHVVFNALDLDAAVLARCTGPRNFLAATAFIYATQDAWIARAEAFGKARDERVGALSRMAQYRALADGAGLTDLLVRRGLPRKAIDACFAEEAEFDRISAMAGEVQTTPTFALNGKRLDPTGWAGLEPQLRAAGAR